MKKFALVAAALTAVSLTGSSYGATLLYQYGFNASSDSAGPPETTTNGGTAGSATLSAAGTATFAGAASGVSGTAGDQAYNYGGTAAGAKATSGALPTTAALNSITVTAWVKQSALNADNGNVRLLEINNPATNDGNPLFFGFNALTIAPQTAGYHLQAEVGGNNPGTATSAGTAGTAAASGNISSGQVANTTGYVFVAFTYDSTIANTVAAPSPNLNYYTGDTSTSVSSLGSGALTLAQNSTFDFSGATLLVDNRPGGDRAYTGLIDELRIYSGVLSQSDLENVRLESVPEPASLSLLGLGGLALLRRRRA